MNTKVCTGCGENKRFEHFNKKSTGRFGLDSRCKQCIKLRDQKARDRNNSTRRKRYKEDTEYRSKVLKRNKEWVENNLEDRLNYLSNWKQNNPEKSTQYWQTHYDKHKEKYLEKQRTRDKRVNQATPSWSDREDILRVYTLCQKITKKTGIPHEVDHIVPIKGVNICGLHVFENLQIVPRTLNRQKSNKWKNDVFEPERKREWE